ncbi:MAG TPA: relaxase domain-containing protein [Acidimicrobiales bacterium]
MLRLLPRRSRDVTYFTRDGAHELDGLRRNGPGWWLRGEGDARDPDEVSRVLTSSDRAQIVGYDIVVAAPRPLSTLLAVDPAHARGLVDAHRVSVRAALDYLEERAVVVRDARRGRQGEESARWQGAVAFTHGLNRHGEPHLHDHVLVGARPEGHDRVLDSRALFAHARAADALYRSSLRHELSTRTPWTAWRSFEGVERVCELDEGYRALWPGHHGDRGEKLHWSRDETLKSWARDLTRYEPLGALAAPDRTRAVLDEHRFAGALEGRDVVARRHLVEAWANAAVFGQNAHELTAQIDALFPRARERAGVYETTVPVREARAIAAVRELGPRPLGHDQFLEWRERSLESSRTRAGRSR